MNLRSHLLIVPMVLAGAACSSSSNDSSTSGGTDGGSGDSGSETADSGTGGNAPVDSGAPSHDAGVDTGIVTFDSGPVEHAFLRVVNASPDGPAIDYCLGNEGNGFLKPVLQTAAGLAYGQASAYGSVVSDYYSVRIVTAGGTCDTNLGGTYSFSLTTLAPNSYTTLVAYGDLTVAGTDPAFTATSYTDDTAATGTGIDLRFVNLSSNVTTADFGTGSLAAASFSPLLVKAAFGATGSTASDAGAVDINRYLATTALSAAAVSAHATGATTDTVTAASVTTTAGDALTVYLIGGKTGTTTNPDQLLACKDGSSATGTGDCTVVSP